MLNNHSSLGLFTGR